MAIRQAIAAKANITYKILFNEAVAMTGGQPVDGVITVGAIARQLEAEGVIKTVVVSDNPDQLMSNGDVPNHIDILHRDELDSIQRELREIKGVTALIYEQTCAAEKRRKRKRGQYPDPAKRIFINDLVCEGCGDCSVQSNCLSIVPKETPFGRKRKVDQSSCNKDYSCVKGFCPSFVTVEGGAVRTPKPLSVDGKLGTLLENLPEADQPVLGRSFDLLVGGVGGTGVVTIGAILTMAAHLEGKGASVLDFMGFAQKGGTVLSYVRLGASPETLNQVRIDAGEADAAIVCDLIVGTDPRSLHVMTKGKTQTVANLEEIPTADFIADRNVDFQSRLRLKTIQKACGKSNVMAVNANYIATRMVGDSVFSNMFLLGFAWQAGLVPISEAALLRAIELNGVAVEKNKFAFALGRAASAEPETVAQAVEGDATDVPPETFDELVTRRYEFLTAYQDKAYADRYRDLVHDVVSGTENMPDAERFHDAVARYFFKLMAYKDEYEVARLYTDGTFRQKVAEQFEGDFQLKFNLAPPLLGSELDHLGRPKKRQFGGWMMGAFHLLARLKGLRGTNFDLFGYTEERKMERRLRDEYETTIRGLLPTLNTANLEVATAIACLPDDIRGYGPVKEASVEKAEGRREELLTAFHQGQDEPKAA